MTATGRARAASALSATDVLIVGGYGNVGQRIARLLVRDANRRVLIGGRHVKRAVRFAATLNGGAVARRVDIDDQDTYATALEGVAAVIMCLDTPELAFPHACITRGIHYLDISASYEVVERLGFLTDLATAYGATILCSVGLAPGLSNLLAKACVRGTDQFVASLDEHLLFGLGDRHGKAALDWMADRLHRPFSIGSGRERREVKPFAERSSAQFPPPFGERATYRLDFSDQHTLPLTLGVPRVSTWTTYDQASVARLLARLARLGVLRWTRYAAVRRLTVPLIGALRGGSDRYALVVEARLDTDDNKLIAATAMGRSVAQATAVIAAEVLVKVLTKSPPAGAYHLDELYDLADFEAALSMHGIEVHAPPAVKHRNDTQAEPTSPLDALRSKSQGVCR